MLDPGQVDVATAHEAARQLRETAKTVDYVVREVQTKLPVVTEDWRGGARSQFDTTVGRRRSQGRALAESLRRLATHIEAETQAQVKEAQDEARKAQEQENADRMARYPTEKTRGVPR